MKVFFGENFWGSFRENPQCGEELKKVEINREFIWEDISGFIPAVYIGKEGMAVDFCIKVPNDGVRAFYDKWKTRMENGLTEKEYGQISEENPLNIDFGVNVWVNGEKLENNFSCGTSYSSVIARESGKAEVEIQLMQEYGCKTDEGWYFKRHMCRWEKEPEMLFSLEFGLKGEDKAYLGEPVKIGTGDIGKKYTVINPVDGNKYELVVKDAELKEIDKEILKGGRKENQYMEYPGKYLQLIYCVEPELPQEVFHLRDGNKGDSPKCMEEYKYAGSKVSVLIGYADGPTSIFIAGKRKVQEDRLAVSALYFEPVEKISWQPVFMEKERADMLLRIDM